LNIETGDPPAGWGVRRTISNKEFRTAEVFERNKKIFFTSIFCGSAVHILDDVIADSEMPSADQGDRIRRSCSPFHEQIKVGFSLAQRELRWARILY
jgi:hypothetical protein